jgi:hypothetical protein
VVGPIVADLAQAIGHVFASVVTLATQRDAGVSGVIPAHAPILGEGVLEVFE